MDPLFICNYCGKDFVYVTFDGNQSPRFCPECGRNRAISFLSVKSVHALIERNTQREKHHMTLSEFSDKLVEYTNDLSPCPFCQTNDELDIRITQPEDSDGSWKIVRITCNKCNLSFDSPVFPEAIVAENKYEEALSAVANHCQAWDIRGDRMPDDE